MFLDIVASSEGVGVQTVARSKNPVMSPKGWFLLPCPHSWCGVVEADRLTNVSPERTEVQ